MSIQISPEQFQQYEQEWNQTVEDGDLEGQRQKTNAAFWLAYYCFYGRVGGVEWNRGAAMQILEQAIQEQDHIDDNNHHDKTGKHRYVLAGVFHFQNRTRANELYRQAFPRLEAEVQEDGNDKNFQEAACCLGKSLFFGRGVDKDPSRGIQLLKAAAELGHEGSLQSLFEDCVYMNGPFVAEVFDWYQEMAGAPHEHAWAQMALGLCFRFGRGVEKDFVKAVEWYNKAIAQGENRAARQKQNLLNELSPEEQYKILGCATRNQKIEKVLHLIEQPEPRSVPLGLWAHAIATLQHQEHPPWESASPTFLALNRGFTPQPRKDDERDGDKKPAAKNKRSKPEEDDQQVEDKKPAAKKKRSNMEEYYFECKAKTEIEKANVEREKAKKLRIENAHEIAKNRMEWKEKGMSDADIDKLFPIN